MIFGSSRFGLPPGSAEAQQWEACSLYMCQFVWLFFWVNTPHVTEGRCHIFRCMMWSVRREKKRWVTDRPDRWKLTSYTVCRKPRADFLYLNLFIWGSCDRSAALWPVTVLQLSQPFRLNQLKEVKLPDRATFTTWSSALASVSSDDVFMLLICSKIDRTITCNLVKWKNSNNQNNRTE